MCNTRSTSQLQHGERARQRARVGRAAGHAAGRQQAGDAVHAVRATAQRAARPAPRAAAALPRLRLHEASAAALRAPGGLCKFDYTFYIVGGSKDVRWIDSLFL